SIVSRNIDPTEHAVVTIGKVQGGSTYNIIPESVTLLGTIRTFSRKNAYLIYNRIEAIVKSVTESAGGYYAFNFNEGYPAVTNDKRATQSVVRTAEALLGNGGVKVLAKPIMAGEDFAFYQQYFPGAFFFLGSGSEQSDALYSWHHPKYNIDEQCFKT